MRHMRGAFSFIHMSWTIARKCCRYWQSEWTAFLLTVPTCCVRWSTVRLREELEIADAPPHDSQSAHRLSCRSCVSVIGNRTSWFGRCDPSGLGTCAGVEPQHGRRSELGSHLHLPATELPAGAAPALSGP